MQNTKKPRMYRSTTTRLSSRNTVGSTAHPRADDMSDSPPTDVDRSAVGRKNVIAAKQHICNECDSRFRTWRYLQDHKKIAHSGGVKCPQCPVVFTAFTNMRRHVREVHNGKARSTVAQDDKADEAFVRAVIEQYEAEMIDSEAAQIELALVVDIGEETNSEAARIELALAADIGEETNPVCDSSSDDDYPIDDLVSTMVGTVNRPISSMIEELVGPPVRPLSPIGRYREHILQNTTGRMGPLMGAHQYFCSICGSLFASADVLVAHIVEAHGAKCPCELRKEFAD